MFINLYIKKQHVFLLRNNNLYTILYFCNQIEFDLESINQEFWLLFEPLNKYSMQYFTTESPVTITFRISPPNLHHQNFTANFRDSQNFRSFTRRVSPKTFHPQNLTFKESILISCDKRLPIRIPSKHMTSVRRLYDVPDVV